ncbi:hypothetical protein [Flavobacterium sp.]|uniref:hypothetical protein n=1 Tax=Flavobacterium sp. TaxID=239 RepID=UPI0026318534|nr:hypothetical protein [Flavobacterium sp.]
MRKIILFTITILLTQMVAFSQVGIGTTSPNASSMLDITSSNSGLLIPRMTEAQKLAIVSPATGLLIFQTNVVSGFWYYNGTTWTTFSASSGWNLTGNAGTNPATNFIGTTDNSNVVFRRNNTRAGLINTTNTSFGINSLNPASVGLYNIGFGASSLFSNTNGGYNVGIGYSAMYKNTTGNFNTSVGNLTLYENLTGESNAAFGDLALRGNISGFQNCAFGTNALITNTIGSQNSAYGVGSLYFSTGNGNTALGYFALNNIVSGDNNIGIGNQAQVPNPNGSNQLSIGNQIYGTNMNDAFLGKIGIGEPNPTEKLDVSGSVKFSGSLMPNNTAGNLGEVLSSNGAGAYPTWVDPNVKPYTVTNGGGIYNVPLTEYTVRVFNGVTNVRLPDAVANLGKIFIIIGSNGITSKTFSTSGGGIYDDVTNATITTLNANQRYMVQSDGTNWIVIGR